MSRLNPRVVSRLAVLATALLVSQLVLAVVQAAEAPDTAPLHTLAQLERVLFTFSAESACSGGTPWFSVRILIAGVEASPASGVDFAFDSTDSNKEGSGSWESHSMQRCRFLTLPSTGNYTVEVDWGASSAGGGTTFRLDDYTITVAQFD